MSGTPVYEVLLEKKGRGRNFSLGRPWTVRTFKLKQQSLEYYDGDKLKGTVDIAGSKTTRISPDKADSKLFPFAVQTKEEELILNASCEEIRNRCIEIFNQASVDKNWSLDPKPAPAPVPAPEPVSVKEEQANKEFEEAAVASAAHIFAENAEKARLEEEQRKLEEERLKQQTAAAAKVMEEELANKKLREAREAEKKQREEQERQVMEMLKGLGAKQRFKAAMANGKMDVARVAAAVMVQGAYRSKLARRRMMIKKAEKERLLQEGYAKKIQCRYRARLARKRMEKIKAEKLAIKKKLSAMKIQCCWRIYLARKKYRLKQEAKLESEFQRSVAKQRSMILLQTCIRRFLGKRRSNRVRITYPSVAYVSIAKTEGLSLSNAAVDPSAYISGVILNLPITHSAKTNPNFKITDELIKVNGRAVSHYKIDAIHANPKQQALASGLTNLDYVAVTLVDKSSKDEFLGQALVRLSDINREIIANGGSNRCITVTVPLTPLLVPIQDEKKENLVQVRRGPAGSVTLNVTIPDPNYTMCGWLWKVSESLLSNAWKKRWFVLVDDQLQYYNSELQLEASKNIVLCANITSIKEEAHKGRQATRINYLADGAETFWMLDWDENANAAIKRMWLRKIYRSSKRLVDPTLEQVKNTVKTVGGGEHNKSVSPMGKTKVPVSKRMSIFK